MHKYSSNDLKIKEISGINKKQTNVDAKDVVENSKLGKQIFLGKKRDTLGLGIIAQDDGTDFLAKALQKKNTNPLYGKFVKTSTKLQTIPSVEKLDEFQYLSGKGGVMKNSAKLKRMEALYAKDKAESLT